ncbi:MAG: molecular chaperone TorD family protein [Gammaproteobacteria bacterium]|nr:molecular chaperone TorD family protein [Gammaproteobacteria bacterium]
MPVDDPMIENEQRYRAAAYSLLAAMLRAAPDQALLDHLSKLSPVGEADEDELSQAMVELADAAGKYDLDQLEDEYNALFIGIGKGEVVPYGSWYLTGFLMEQPLSDLRDDLQALGFERDENTHEPEDHAAAIFEVFSVMITDASSLDQQQDFFEKHLQTWLKLFFTDLGKARSVKFYKPVARFGAAFIELEQAYLSMRS